MPTFSHDEIESCRIVCRQDDDSLHLRSRIAACLSRTTLHPSDIPPSSILLINKLQCVFPSSTKVKDINSADDQRWMNSMKSELNRLSRNAHSPHGAFIPNTAEAILFSDEAELLASFLSDLAHGEVAHRWWWKHIGRGIRSFGDMALRSMLLPKPNLIPAVVSLLQKKNELFLVLNKMPDILCRALLIETCRCFNTPWIIALVNKQTQSESGHVRFSDSAEKTEIASRDAPHGTLEKAHPPWTDTPGIAKTAVELPPLKELLRGICLVLADRPFMVRQSSFQGSVSRWWDSASDDSARRGPPPIPATVFYASDGAGNFRKKRGPEEKPIDERHAADAVSAGDRNSAQAAIDKHTFAIPADETAASLVRPGSTIEPALQHEENKPPHEIAEGQWVDTEAAPPRFPVVSPLDDARPHARSEITIKPDTGLNAPTESSPSVIDHREKQSATRADDSVPLPEKNRVSEQQPVTENKEAPSVHVRHGRHSTKFGSVFYLVNLFNKLSIPDAFENDWGLASEIGPWGTLDITARFLAALDIPDCVDAPSDPLFRVLGELSGLRDEGVYGTSLRVPARPELPPLWKPLKIGDSLSASTTVSSSALLSIIAPPALQWASLCVPYIRQWVLGTLALGPSELFSRTALGCPASLFLSSSHVDVVFDLEDVSLPVRMAGLDQDPGWLQSYGRVLQFHFEKDNA